VWESDEGATLKQRQTQAPRRAAYVGSQPRLEIVFVRHASTSYGVVSYLYVTMNDTQAVQVGQARHQGGQHQLPSLRRVVARHTPVIQTGVVRCGTARVPAPVPTRP
jgi:hypothetical protein